MIPLRVNSEDRIDLKVKEYFLNGGGGDALVKTDTVEGWNSRPTYIPEKGEINVYTDFEVTTDISGQEVFIPAIKIGDGQSYGVDLPFVGDDLRLQLMLHMTNEEYHVATADRLLWNNKLNVDDAEEVIENTLILNRN